MQHKIAIKNNTEQLKQRGFYVFVTVRPPFFMPLKEKFSELFFRNKIIKNLRQTFCKGFFKGVFYSFIDGIFLFKKG
jgi:hypothetical protein